MTNCKYADCILQKGSYLLFVQAFKLAEISYFLQIIYLHHPYVICIVYYARNNFTDLYLYLLFHYVHKQIL